jgi:paraquat-inducible protein B
MSKPASKTLIGGFVVGAVVLVVAGVLIFGSGRFLTERINFVMYFEGSVKGLNVGGPVVFRGVKIGTVTDILLRYNPADMSVKIPVIIEIDPDRVDVIGGVPHEADPQRAISQLVERGLRARLQMQSLVTGQLMVELDFHLDKPVKLVGGDTGYPEIPTIPSPLKELSKRVEKVPIEEIFQKLLAAVEGIEGIVNSPEVKGIISSLNLAAEDISKLVRNIDGKIEPLASNIEDVGSSIEGTMGETRKLVRNINAQIKPLASSIKETAEDYGKLARNVDGQIAPLGSSIAETLEEVRAALDQGRKTLAVAEDALAEDSPLLYELDNVLKEVSAAARSIRLLADYLKRHPEALIKGKGRSGGK